MKKVCRHCRRKFKPCPHVKNQQFCGKPECRRAWKREWQRRKRSQDVDYQANQDRAQKAWRERYPEYWQEYRQRNPASTEKNRLKQRERNRANRHPAITTPPPMIAKMDSLKPENVDPVTIRPGRYCMIPVVDGMIAKMDSKIVEIRSVCGLSGQTGNGGP